LEAVGKPSDLVLSHPPCHSFVKLPLFSWLPGFPPY
jgi:hypothetical protein